MGQWQRPRLVPGIYDELITERVNTQLRELGPGFEVLRKELAKDDLAVPAVTTLLKNAVELALSEQAGREDSLELATRVLHVLREHAPKAFKGLDELQLHKERLEAIVAAPARPFERPRGSLHVSSLIANAEGESLIEHLRSEFDSADRIDLLCAFVKLSGVERLRSVLERHCSARGRPLRVLTTTYMQASEAKAIERLAALPNAEVRVSFDEDSTRLHAKAWIFHRASGASTAYVGSSNLSHAAQTEGLEWNVRLTASDQPTLLEQMRETFEQYWADPNLFERFDLNAPTHRTRLSRALSPRLYDGGPSFLAELEPKDFQKPVLEELAHARKLGRHRNLLVAATGTGKTVMAALDYRALRAAGAVETLLFVAHRREILEQAQRTYQAALQEQGFGELLFEGHRPHVGRHVFASIDSIGKGSGFDPTSFDMVVLDEAHHAAADKWEGLLKRIQPKELLGLTGTPERTDGLSYETYFPKPWVGNLRVWNAIPHALVPFRYYLLDVQGVDLRDVEWSMGRYVPEELATKLIGAAEIYVQRVVAALRDHVARIEDLRAIAFCSNVRHAEEVHRRFTEQGLRAQLLTGETPAAERRSARDELNAGRIQVLCVVDIYNEGVDVPNVNALFFFRPTESATVFLQQLGRGLRRASRKAELVVFDLTGRQHHNFRFDQRFRGMLGHTPRELRELFETGQGRLPSGCHFQFDERAGAEVLSQLERSIPQDRKGLLTLLREPSHAGASLAAFLHETEVELETIYRKGQSWFRLRKEAGLAEVSLTSGEEEALAHVHKLLHVSDDERLNAWAGLLRLEHPRSERGLRLMRMLFAVLYGKDAAATEQVWATFRSHSVLREELAQLGPVLRQRSGILSEPHQLSAEVPLVLHARYLGVELSAAFDQRTKAGKFRDYYTGVETTSDKAHDLLLTTLQKSESQKEHLRYRDFPLNERQFHWQSKARTTQDSLEGQRLIRAGAMGCRPLLFVRERADERPGVTMAFQYLGPVHPARVEGERPMTIVWDLLHPMPAEAARHGRVAA